MTGARSVIGLIRDGGYPSKDDLRWFAAGLASGVVTDAQAGAFAMAVLLKGLNEEGRVALTRGMRESGKVMAWDLTAYSGGLSHARARRALGDEAYALVRDGYPEWGTTILHEGGGDHPAAGRPLPGGGRSR